MAGNLAEWVNDWHDETYYAVSPLDNPQGPAEGFFRALRGGSWYGNADSLRTTDRNWYIPDGGTDYVGFRCAQSAIAPYSQPNGALSCMAGDGWKAFELSI